MDAETESLRLMTMSLGVRPIRTALLAHLPEGLPWQGVMRAAVSSQTAIWGGSGNIVLPYDASVADNEVLWALLDVFDADRVALFTPSWGELETMDAERYGEGRVALDHKLGAAAAAEELSRWRDEPYGSPQSPADLEGRLVQRLAPFHSPGATIPTLTGAWFGPFAETSIATIGLPKKKLVDQSPGLPSPGSLYAAAVLGRYSPAARDLVEELGVTVGDYSTGTGLEILDLYDKGRPDREAAYPWDPSDSGLGHYRRSAAHRHPVVVAGDDAWDFALFYALRRMGETVWWCPDEFLADSIFRMRLMPMLDRAATSARVAHVVSASSHLLAGDVADRLRSEIFQSKRPIKISHSSWRNVLPDDPSRLFERDRYGLPQAVLLENGVTPELPTPLPAVAPGAGPADLHWITEVRSDGWTPLRNGELGTELLEQHLYDSEYLRTTRDGVAYYCPNYAWAGTPSLEAVVARPKLRPWPLLEQVREIAHGDGWRVDPSDKGIYASESVALFGGFNDLDNALRDGPTRAIFDAYVRRDDVGLFLNSDRRRYLDVTELRDLAKGAPDADVLIASLLEKGVLARGYPLKCARCRQVSWYPLDDVGTTFRCARCRLVQEVAPKGFLTGVEPVLRYRLSEVMFQMLEHDGDLPLRAVVRLTEGSMRPLDYCFELEFVSQKGAKTEHDIVVSDGYRLWIGEATSSDRLEKSASDQHHRLVELKAHAEMLGAYGVVLATTAPAFWDKLTAQAKSKPLFGGPWPKLVLMEGLN